jgi:Zn-dependent protease with chaperone function
MSTKIKTTAYRYPNELLILWVTILVVLGVIVFTAAATACLSVAFMLVFVVLAYQSSKSHHQGLMQNAQRVGREATTDLSMLIDECAQKLQVEPVQVFVLPSRVRNAYTFGMESPKAIVLYSALLPLMDREEMQFIVGHEMGHICLGHTRLNTLIGGMAGIPSNIASAVLMHLAFLWWNRACEYSADRAGMLACGNPNKAISALIKLEAGGSPYDAESLARVAQRIEAEDDDVFNNIGEALGTHPMVVRRINQIRNYAQSAEYHRLQIVVDQNLL